MDVMGKLFTLFQDCNNPSWKWFPNNTEMLKLIEYLVANGVTVQEWISVKDRLPEPFVSVLVQMPGEEPFPTVREGFISNNGIWQSAMFRREPGEVTHWQPMPLAPEENDYE